MKHCYRCGTTLADNAITCVSCGAIQPIHPPAPVAPPIIPPLPDSTTGTNTLSIIASVYLALVGLSSLAYFALIPIFNLAFRLMELFLIALPNLFNIGAVIFLIIQLLKRKKNSPLFFTIWAGMFFIFQIIGFQMIWRGWHVFRSNGLFLLWVGVNFLVIVPLIVALFSNQRKFNR